MNQKYNRNSGDRIWFDINNDGKLAGYGIICGVASGPFPALGYQWIIQVEPPYPFKTEVYPFTHITVFDNMIKEPPTKKE